MRILILPLLTVLLTFSLNAQPWLENLPAGKPKHELTLFDYQKAFETYWAPFHVDKGTYFENGERKKAPGWKQFKRWEYEMSSRVHPGTGEFPKQSAMEVRTAFEKTYPGRSPFVAADWTPMGPTSSFSGYSGIGRLNCVAFHPTDLNTYWVGAAAGGLWMTTDNGASWTCQTDQNGVLAVSSIVIPQDYETSNTIYIGTGDRDGWDNRSIGILKSTDRGLTWTQTGLSFTIYEGQMTNRLLIDPTNQQILIAATTRGVYKTTDGGATWNLQMTPIEFIDIEFNPLNSNIIYGSTKNGEIYLSADGATFTGPVYSDGNARRIELAVSPNQPSWVYAIASNSESGLYGIFKSTDYGNSFAEVFSGSTKNLLTWGSDGAGTGGQGWYDLCIASSPFDANIILIGGVNTWRSTDGGLSWSIVNHWWGDQVQAVHADKHNLVYRQNGDLFECNDGGIYFSQDHGSNWLDKTNGIQISQMYRLGVSQTEAEDVITGLQDNGTKLHSGNNWFDVRGGDGMECLIDYSDAEIQYGSVYFGQIDRTDNHWMSSSDVTPPDDGAWVTPYIIDPVNPSTIYGGYNEVWKSVDRGENWEQISFFDPNGNILSMGIAASDPQHIYVATYNRIWRTTDGGSNWANITNNLPTNNANIEYITVHHEKPNTVWVTLSGYSNPGVYQTIDGGMTWTSISDGLPPIPVTSVVHNKQKTDVVHLYAGTELGVYFKSGNEDWVPYNTGLPNVKIGEVEIYYSDNPGESKLRAATYGRGLWETPIEYTPSPMVYVTSTSRQNNQKEVAPDQVNQEILKVEITTTGNLNPFNASSFTFNTQGSTDAVNDISNARLFYSGSSGHFSTAVQFGEAVAAPNGEFVITGSQPLTDGRNHFWLTYDLPATATLGHILDAECTSVTVETPRPLSVTAPEGSRTIGYEYCEAGAAQMTYEYISNFKMGAVNQPSGKGPNGYEDYSAQVIDMIIGREMDFIVENGVPYATDEVLVWVDWNIDGDFDEADEFVFASGPSGAQYFSGAFAPPATAKPEKTKMRVRLHDRDNGPNQTPCGYGTWGEVEDYAVRVSSPGPCSDLNYFAHKAESIGGLYIDLGAEGQVIPTADFDNANSAPQEIGFAFQYNCDTFTQFILNTNGFIKLGSLPPSDSALFYEDPRVAEGGLFGSDHPADINILAPLNLDLGPGTDIPEYRVHTTGSSPDRICTIQYKNVKEANSNPIPQYDNMQFQIKLYETTHVIEFVYGNWIPSGNQPDLRPVACGLKGSGSADHQVLMVSKRQEEEWRNVTFANENIPYESAIYYQSPQESPKPDKGRIFRFNPRYNHDLAVTEIYALAEASIYHTSPQSIGVNIENTGWDTFYNTPVTLVISGVDTFTDTQHIPFLASGDHINIYFSNYIPDSIGDIQIAVHLPEDEILSNNLKTWSQSVTDFHCNYTYDDPNRLVEVTEGQDTVFFARYKVYGTAQVQAVTAHIYQNAFGGETVYGILLDEQGNIMGQSDPYDIQDEDMGSWVTLSFPTPPVLTNESFYAGIAVPDPRGTYFFLDAQKENPLRPETFYTAATEVQTLVPFNSPYRFMIGAILSPTPPSIGFISGGNVFCSGETAHLQLSEYTGTIQWQESPDGINSWFNVNSGEGWDTPNYTTPSLLSTTFYRVEISQPTFPSLYSNVEAVIVHDQPADAGGIAGDIEVCQGDSAVVYFVAPIPNTSLYIWSFPDGALGMSTTNLVEVKFFDDAVSGEITVQGQNGLCSGAPSSLQVTVYPKPGQPVITQNGNVLTSSSVSGNQWYGKNGLIPGATDQDLLVNTDGNYYVIVTENGCSSEPSNVIQVMITSIEIAGTQYSVSLHPNPVSDDLTIEIQGNTQSIPFELVNPSGQEIIKGEVIDHKTIQTTGLAPGTYFLKLKNDVAGGVFKIIKI